MTKIKKSIYIEGMHCVSCEMLIKKSSEEINGVEVEYISANKWVMHVRLPNEEALAKIKKAIIAAWYKIIDEKQKNMHKRIERKQLVLSVLIVGVLMIILYTSNVMQYIPATTGENLSLWVALLMGLIASVSTCLAIVGSIVIWFSQYLDTSKWTIDHIKTQISFHAGRIWWFFVLWWLLWLIGKTIAISFTMTTILTMIAGIIVLWMGLHLLNILPNITTMGVHLPKKRSKNMLTTKNPAFAPLIGALTFFLPCGFTLSMQLIAINTGSFLQGGLAMALFALGTLPVLFAVWLGSSYIKEKKFKLLHTIIWTLIVFFGIFMINNARRMFWWASTFTNTQVINQEDSSWAYERREVGHNWFNVVPETIILTAGKNYELIITPSSNGKWCMVTMTIPSLDRTVHRIIKDQRISYKFNNIKKWSYPIVCGTMGMYQWKILVQ